MIEDHLLKKSCWGLLTRQERAFSLLPFETENPQQSAFSVFDGHKRTEYPLLIDLF